MKNLILGLVTTLLSTSAFAYQYNCKFTVGWPAGQGDSVQYSFESDNTNPLQVPFQGYQFVVQKLPPQAGDQIQLRIVDPFGGMSTANFETGYRQPFVASRHDSQQSAAWNQCKLQQF